MSARVMTAAMLLLAGAMLTAQSYPPAFPRPNATKLLDNGQIVAWKMVWPRGQPTEMHRHVHDQVGTYYAEGGRLITSPDGTKRQAMTPVGNISTTKRGTTHIEEGTTDPPLRAVFVELLHDGPSGHVDTKSTVTPAFPRDGAEQRLDDERVTVWDYTWKTPVPSAPVRYPRNTLIVWLGSGTLRVTSADDRSSTLTVAAGDTRYSEAGTVERIDLVSGTPRAMVFEFK